MKTCFKNVFKQGNSNKTIQLPTSKLPTTNYRRSLIKQGQVTPCMHDQLSIIILKRCPNLRTYIHKIITHCWTHRLFPRCWKYVFKTYIYKTRSNTESSNFRPITLQPVLAKICSSLIRNRIYNFLMKNDFVETSIQNGFWKEYLEQLSM